MSRYETRKTTEQGRAETLRRRSIRDSRNTVRADANKAYGSLLAGRSI